MSFSKQGITLRSYYTYFSTGSHLLDDKGIAGISVFHQNVNN